MKDGKPFMTVAFGTAPPETFAIDYTLGAKRYQGYLSTLPDGRIYVLPAFWHIATKRWIDWKEITPIPDAAHDIRQIWNVNCFNCHGTNIVQGYDLASKDYKPSWTEMGIGCEACHGPGREHVATMEQWEKDPASKPAYDNSSKNRQLSDDPQDLLDPQLGAAPHLRHVRVLPRQQDQHLHRFQGRRSLCRLRAAVPDQRADSAQRSARRVLARRPAQPLQSPAGAHAERLLQGRRDRVHELPRRPRIAQRLLVEGEHQPGPHRRLAVHAVPHDAQAPQAGARLRQGPARGPKPQALIHRRRPCSVTRFTRPIPPAAVASAVT